MTPYRAQEPFDWGSLLALIRAEFAYMDARIDPPSSMHRLTVQDLADVARNQEVWVMGVPVQACAVFTQRADALYVGKLAVASAWRGQGRARVLLQMADTRAAARGLAWLELETRVELAENQAMFTAMGFVEVARSAHAGFDRPTSITYRRAVGP